MVLPKSIVIRLMVYLVRPWLLIVFSTIAPSDERLCGELPPSVASVKLKRRFGKVFCALITLWMRLVMTSWLCPPLDVEIDSEQICGLVSVDERREPAVRAAREHAARTACRDHIEFPHADKVLHVRRDERSRLNT